MNVSSLGRRRSPERWIWALAIVVLGICGALIGLHVGRLHALTKPHIPWWALALGFAAAERAVVHLHFRRSAHSFTLADVPMVLGLIFASAPQLLIGAVLGSAVMWIVDRRLPPLKVVFNVAQLTLATCVALTIVHAFSGTVHSIRPILWLITFGAVEAGALVTVALISIAITLSEGALPKGMLGQMFGLDFVLTVANTALALVAAVVIKTDSEATPLMLLPAAIVYVAYRAYLTERQRRERLDFLYQATRTLAHAPDVMVALEGLLDRSREAFRVELAELLLFSTDGQSPLRVARPPAAATDTTEPVDGGIADELRALVSADSPAVVVKPSAGDGRLDGYLRARGVEQAIVALLPGDGRVIGTVMLANRVGVVRSFDADDLKLLEALANNTSVALQFDRLEQAIWQLRELHDALEHQASHDPLTNLANRALFVHQVRNALAHDTGSVAVLFIDVDDFKTVNDTVGHSGGDDLLIAIAQRLQGCVLPADLIARLGGDEFAILLRDVAEPAQAGIAVADRIIRALAAPTRAAGKHMPVGASIGIATGRAGYESADELIRNADIAMYHAKHSGKGRSELFEPRMRSAVIERHSLQADLERALERGQLTVDYQPIISLGDRRVVAAEALVRWPRQYGTMLTASEFVPMARETGLIVPIGEFVVGDACRQAHEWLGDGRFDANVAVHVNLSAPEVEDRGLVAQLAGLLEQTGLPPNLLVLEVAEAAILRDPARATAHLTELHAIGVRLALDDFGTGYSSLAYLRSLPFSFVKIARPVVESITSGPRAIAFLRTTNELCETLGLEVIATGIETEEQLDLLRSLGCNHGQGFLLGRPAAGQSILAGAYPAAREPAEWLRGLPDDPDALT